MPWTRFMDMHSGGGTKEPPYEYIYIEAPIEEAKVVFYNRFGHNPERVSCTCCGDDYIISQSETLQAATAFERGCDFVYFRPDGTEAPEDEAWKRGVGMGPGYSHGYVERPSRKPYRTAEYQTLDQYLRREDVLAIRADEVRPEERRGEVPVEGYVWVGV